MEGLGPNLFKLSFIFFNISSLLGNDYDTCGYVDTILFISANSKFL